MLYVKMDFKSENDFNLHSLNSKLYVALFLVFITINGDKRKENLTHFDLKYIST